MYRSHIFYFAVDPAHGHHRDIGGVTLTTLATRLLMVSVNTTISELLACTVVLRTIFKGTGKALIAVSSGLRKAPLAQS
jgi:hypothetical protein